MDNAYSPIWQHLKLAWLRPLVRLSHRREPRSPEDARETMAGGFREERLAEVIRGVGGIPWFERVAYPAVTWSLLPACAPTGPCRASPGRGET